MERRLRINRIIMAIGLAMFVCAPNSITDKIVYGVSVFGIIGMQMRIAILGAQYFLPLFRSTEEMGLVRMILPSMLFTDKNKSDILKQISVSFILLFVFITMTIWVAWLKNILLFLLIV